MRNRPKYNLLKNARYAIDGFFEVLKGEKAFQIELTISIAVWLGLIFFDIPFVTKALLALSMFIILIAELGNSAIERVVDLASPEYSELAKNAKDAASAMVLLSVVLTGLIWACTIFYLFTFYDG